MAWCVLGGARRYPHGMPELPDVSVYVEAIARRVVGRVLGATRVRGPNVLRTFDPTLEECEGRRVVGVERLGKRVVLAFDGGLFIVVHLMIAGRFRWLEPGEKDTLGRIGQAWLRFGSGTLVLTEAGKQKRAAVHVVRGREGVGAMARAGVEPLECSVAEFGAALRRENRTLKRALADPSIVAGVGNAYSDEVLWRAGVSPLKLTRSLSDGECAGLHGAMVGTLREWTARLMREFGLDGEGLGRFPGAGEITAFRPEFGVHGRFGKKCPVCGVTVQRIVYATNECNYCPGCQTGGKVLADRSMSRLLKADWARTVEELEERERGANGER